LCSLQAYAVVISRVPWSLSTVSAERLQKGASRQDPGPLAPGGDKKWYLRVLPSAVQ
jgi:hypothetical protein